MKRLIRAVALILVSAGCGWTPVHCSPGSLLCQMVGR